MPHPSAELFAELKRFSTFPDGVTANERMLPGVGFFPAASGLVNPTRDGNNFPHGGVMVLGHDWGTIKEFTKLAKGKGGEDVQANPTWYRLLEFLPQVEIDPAECFFTNFFVGLRATGSSVGKSPGSGNVAYVNACRAFLVRQIEVLRPRIILVLGIHVPRLIAPISADLAAWRSVRSFSALDRNNLAVIDEVRLAGSKQEFSAVALVHPSYRHLNAKARAWQGLRGHEAEVALVKSLRRGPTTTGTPPSSPRR